MYAEQIILTITDFEQGGFYVDNYSDYNSDTEIRSGVHDLTPQWSNFPIYSLTIKCPGYQWSFVCFDENGAFQKISESLNYKNSGDTFDLSAYSWIRKIRVELHLSTGINPPASCEVVIKSAWQINNKGVLVNTLSPPLPVAPFTSTLPKSVYRVENGILTHKLLQELPKKPFIPELPKAVYRVFDADLLHLLLPKKDFSQEVTPFIVNNKGVECNIFYFGNLPTYFVVYRTKMSRNATERGGDTNAE